MNHRSFFGDNINNQLTPWYVTKYIIGFSRYLWILNLLIVIIIVTTVILLWIIITYFLTLVIFYLQTKGLSTDSVNIDAYEVGYLPVRLDDLVREDSSVLVAEQELEPGVNVLSGLLRIRTRAGRQYVDVPVYNDTNSTKSKNHYENLKIKNTYFFYLKTNIFSNWK